MRYVIEYGKALLSSYEPEEVSRLLSINVDCRGILRVVSDFEGSPIFIEYDPASRSYKVPKRALSGRVTMAIMKEGGNLITLQPLLSIPKEGGNVIVLPDASDVLRRLAEAEASILGLSKKNIELEKKQTVMISRIERLFEGYNI